MKYVFSILLLACVIVAAIGQGKSKPIVIYKDGDRSKGVEKIVFKDEQGTLTGEFDVQANNPYSNLLKQATPTNDPTWRNTYEIKPTKVRSLMPESADLKNNSALDQEVKFVGTQVRRLGNGKGKLCGLIHNVQFFDKYREIKYSTAKLQLLNEDGSLKKELNPKTNINVAVVTNNEKYIGITYGGTVDHNGYQVYEDGFSIYDIENGEEVITIQTNNQRVTGALARYDDMLVFGVSKGHSRTYYVASIAKRVLFKKEYDINKVGGKKISTDGFILRDGTNDLFEEVFEKITF